MKVYESYPYINTLLTIQIARLLNPIEDYVAVDIGAYTGDFCVRCAGKFKKVTFHAIEPSRNNYVKLNENTSRFQNVLSHQFAISDSSGEGLLYGETSKLSQSNSLYEHFANSKNGRVGCEKIRTITLSDFCFENEIDVIDVLIMNCEGAEYKIFGHKPSQSFLAKVKLLHIALHGKSYEFQSMEYNDKKRDINIWLVKNGFRLLYGEELSKMNKLPTGHIQQVWLRSG